MKVDRYFRRYEEVTPQVLAQEQVKLLLCDLDFTLVPRWISQPTSNFTQWLRDLKRHNIEVVIVSNNRSKKRIEKFIQNLRPTCQISFLYQAKKPGLQAIMDVICHSKYQVHETALLGDRMHTDVAAANNAGIKAWKVPHRFRL